MKLSELIVTEAKKFKENDRVILPANEDEPEQKGYVMEVEGRDMYIVSIDDEYIDQEAGDDGIREVHADDMKLDTSIHRP